MSMVMNQLIEYNGIQKCFPENNKYFKQENISNVFCVPKQKPDIEQIVKVWAETSVEKYNFVTTPIGLSLEGQQMTGLKLFVSGTISLKYQYVACDTEQTVHTAEGCMPFCSYIVMSKDTNISQPIFVRVTMEDIFSKQLDCRCIHNNFTLMVSADIC